jgi:type IV pilus assembly protein PilP
MSGADYAIQKSGIAYSAEGRINPFAPLITQKEEEPPLDSTGPAPVPERILTPLEKLDYSQIRLVAIVEKGRERIAMVEETGGSNKGYIIRLGTFVGQNGGKVVSIGSDRIVVEETVRNFKGELTTRSQEMKLRKPEDEG